MATEARARERAATMPPGKLWKGRPLHQTTLCLGDQTPCYSTTHTQSFCGRRDDGQPLVFLLRDPCYPSQHRRALDLRNVLDSVSSTHSRDVHSPKDITPERREHRQVLGSREGNVWRGRCVLLTAGKATAPRCGCTEGT
ncbi:hypothetical protein KOW79_001209 [Hemibagrus wyckioides]|uniref:Uncharacterized protein n=1 Tax=Hemibagrus wyckioides TaxID=337641 RepID=A0A9D3P4Q4_9TELE|nr:hypothetical protein KOW79_001209 [Hemibagrus wyckioides]